MRGWGSSIGFMGFRFGFPIGLLSISHTSGDMKIRFKAIHQKQLDFLKSDIVFFSQGHFAKSRKNIYRKGLLWRTIKTPFLMSEVGFCVF